MVRVTDALLLQRASRLVESCRAREIRIVTAESVTGGLVASAIAQIAGASSVLEGGVVAYSRAMKSGLLGLSREDSKGAREYRPEVALAMAQGALAHAKLARLAVGVTGVAGPGPDEGVPAGRVWMAAVRRGGTRREAAFAFEGSRNAIRREAALRAIDLLRSLAEAEPASR